MDSIICVVFITINVWQCNGVSIQDQLDHIVTRRRESQGIPVADFFPSRRYYDFHPARSSVVLGAPSMVSHLPEAEPILPGHTLIRPSLDMLKSSIKFPHKDMDDGAGVYGNIDNLSIRWDGRNDRVLYTGFRRMDDRDGTMAGPEPSRSNDLDSRLLADLLRKKRNKKIKKFGKPQRPAMKNLIYESIYPFENEKTKLVNVQQPVVKNNKDFHVLMDKIRKLAKRKDRKKRQRQKKKNYSRTQKKRRPRPRASATYAYVNLDDIDQVLRTLPTYRDPKERAVVVLHNSDEHASEYDDLHEESDEEVKMPQTVYDNAENDSKRTWFWNSKDTFNHINISPEAPELYELIPVQSVVDNSKKWWFYHEADFEPFDKID